VDLSFRFTPGWPWPESSWGLDPMYGPHGWCHACGTPTAPQTGHLTLQGNGFPAAPVFVPHWQYDAVCLDAATAATVASGFRVAMREVHKPRTGGTGVQQLLPEVTGSDWYDPTDLAVAARDSHPHDESVGSTCQECGHWRWLPLSPGQAPARLESIKADGDVIASPEIFGAGWKTFRHLLFRRPLAELLVAANPRTWSIREVPVRTS
jgi:hypothetical protein